jgi:phosphate/sulfate permease
MNPVSILIIFIIISMLISGAIGSNDESWATIYGAKTLTMREILILAAILAVLGTFFLGRSVSETVGNDILYIELTTSVVLTILISTALWLIFASVLKIPISTTHATIGAIIGIGIFLGGWTYGLNWDIILYMSLWWILSPIIGFIVTYITYKLLHKFIMKKQDSFRDFEKKEKIFTYILLIVMCLAAFSRAGNDCSKAIGIVVGIGSVNIDLLLFITGLSFASGIVILGRNVIKSVGRITELYPSNAFAAEIPNAAILFIGTLEGVPLSGSHMLVASLIGLAKARHAPIEKGLWKIIFVWFLTFPAAAILSIIMYFPVSLFF